MHPFVTSTRNERKEPPKSVRKENVSVTKQRRQPRQNHRLRLPLFLLNDDIFVTGGFQSAMSTSRISNLCLPAVWILFFDTRTGSNTCANPNGRRSRATRRDEDPRVRRRNVLAAFLRFGRVVVVPYVAWFAGRDIIGMLLEDLFACHRVIDLFRTKR